MDIEVLEEATLIMTEDHKEVNFVELTILEELQ
jgi:hypothetical protein